VVVGDDIAVVVDGHAGRGQVQAVRDRGAADRHEQPLRTDGAAVAQRQPHLAARVGGDLVDPGTEAKIDGLAGEHVGDHGGGLRFLPDQQPVQGLDEG
jgi:hypothetical protein